MIFEFKVRQDIKSTVHVISTTVAAPQSFIIVQDKERLRISKIWL